MRIEFSKKLLFTLSMLFALALTACGENGNSISTREFALPGIPGMISPVAGSTLGGVNQTFQWDDNGAIVEEYTLYVGSEVGVGDIFWISSLGTATSRDVTGIPTDGRKIFARLWYKISGVWAHEDTQYFASGSAPTPLITSPAAGALLGGSNVTLNWDANGAYVGNWWVYAGAGAGTASFFNSGTLPGGTTSVLMTGLPTTGQTVHVTLWYYAGGAWASIAASYNAAYGSVPGLTTPTYAGPGTVFPAVNTNGGLYTQGFVWTPNGQTVDYWWLYVGSTQGSNNIYDSTFQWGFVGTDDVANIGVQFQGQTIWVRVWYFGFGTGVGWRWVDFQYTLPDRSCVGICAVGDEEVEHPNGGCYCDDLCNGFGDCCPNKIAACGE